MAEYLVTGVYNYDFNDKDGKQISGVHVHFLEQVKDTPGFNGWKPGKFRAGKDVLASFVHLPGFYDLDLKVSPAADGKFNISIVDANIVGDVNFSSLPFPPKNGGK